MLNSSNFNYSSPIFFLDNSLSYFNDSIPYFELPSPLIYDDVENLGELLVYNNHDDTISEQALNLSNYNNSETAHGSPILEMISNKGDEVYGVVEDGEAVNKKDGSKKRRRRSSNKDRHSKIRTANGLRDRRMRLSLAVARPFFKLQDMLGFDKASRTVEWLLTQSKHAIEEVVERRNASPSGVTKCTIATSVSDCEEVESVVIVDEPKEEATKVERNSSSLRSSPNNKVQKRKRTTTKEARKDARERAKMRTLQRMMQSREDQVINAPFNGNWSPLTNFSYQPNGPSAAK